MTITPVGYLFFAAVLAGVLLTIGVNRRWAKNGKPIGIGASVFVGLILVTMSTLFFMFSYFGADGVYQMMTFPKYEATIISFDSAWDEVTRTDSDGDRYIEDVLMHTPTLRFVDDTGQVITQRGNIRSGAEPVIGETVTVGYSPGRSLQVISIVSIGLYIGLAVMLMILGYILISVLFFTLGRKPKWLETAGRVLLVYIVIGGGMLGMLAGMVYGVYGYFQPGSDTPLWAMLLSAFFSIVLALSLVGMFLLPKKTK